MTEQLKTAVVVFAALAVISYSIDAHAEGTQNKPLAGWSAIVDPDNDCQIESTLCITVPDTNHDLNPRRGMNAPRLLKKVKGDFTVQVKVTSDFKPGDASTGPGRPFNGAGLLIWDDEDNFLRLERNAYWVADSLFCYPPLIEHWHDGKYSGFNSSPTRADEFFKGRSTWLKLRRQDTRITASFSHDGDEWTVAKEFTVDFPDEVSAGIAALNTSNAAFSVAFEAFEFVGSVRTDEPK
jgi:regulation of enolase protein 1 (concanavalin A-like superfamily)